MNINNIFILNINIKKKKKNLTKTRDINIHNVHNSFAPKIPRVFKNI